MGCNGDIRNYLFYTHSNDLSSLRNFYHDEFICPICLTVFTKNELSNNKLTDGHVWPKDIRNKSGTNIIKKQRVLLCKQCNSFSGSYGDKQMQLRENIKDSEKQGILIGDRKVEITQGFDKKISLKAKVSLNIENPSHGTLTFLKVSEGNWAGNNPTNIVKFNNLPKEKPFSLLIHPNHELNNNLAKVGWVTAAYLFSFYTFGYRYILDDDLNFIRDYITKSFKDKSVKFSESNKLNITECKSCDFNTPQIHLVKPLSLHDAYLEVSLFNYHITLPPPKYNHDLLQQYLRKTMGNYNQMATENRNNNLYIPITCNKMENHDCFWDYLLGKPSPIIG